MSINIVLSNAGPFYSEGVIEGNAICVSHSKINIRGIKIKLIGRERNSWHRRERHGHGRKKKWKSVHYVGDKIFLEIDLNLVGGGEMEMGKFEYPFRLILPKLIPSTYKGAHGGIRYSLKANIDIPMAFDYEDEIEFLVKSRVDLNNMLDRIILNPTQYEGEKNVSCCCWSSGPITMETSLEKEAFVLGDNIEIKVYINNMSNVSIVQLRVELRRTVTERCTLPRNDTKCIKDTLLQAVNTGVGAHGDRTYFFTLPVPLSLELPDFTICELFSQWFSLQIVASIPGCHRNLDMDIPITLGHIPVRGQENLQNEQDALKSGNTIPNVQNSNDSTSASSSLYPAASAPSDDAAPSAPPKSDLVDGNDFIIDGSSTSGNSNPPPPSYYEATKETKP